MNIIDKIEELKHNTLTNIENVQRAKIPVIYELQLERKYSFDTHGFFHSAYDESWLLFTCRNLPYASNLKRHIFSDSLENMVNNKEIRPMLIFIDHKLVKWSDIMIIKDCNFSYILIMNNSNLHNPVCECILLPENIEYLENSQYVTDNTIFMFSEEGLSLASADGGPYTIVNSKDKDIFYTHLPLNEGTKQLAAIDNKYKMTKSNFIFFKNGYLDTSVNIELHGLNVYSANNNSFNGNKYISKQFYYTKSNLSLDNLTNPINKDNIISRLKRSEVPQHILQLAESFDFKFDRDKEYEENITEALIYIMAYNSRLMNDIYKQSSNIYTRLYKGKDINKLKDEKGYVTMSRRINGTLENYPIIFHNGDLYKYYSELKYKNKNFTFPVVDILDSDDIEIVFFKNVDNRVFPLYLASGDDNIEFFDSSIDLSNYKLYSINPENQLFNIERSIRTQYEVPFTFDIIEKNKYHIKLGNSYHYDRNLTLASDKQFRYISKVAQEDLIDIMLPSDFYYCSDITKYMVFINNRKIDRDNFIITLANENRPFDDISIYFNIPVLKGDKVDIFYVSQSLEEIANITNISSDGIIVIDRNKISYDLDNELYMIFVNGRKINPNQLVEMNSNRLKIITDLKSLKNLCILKHVKDDDILSELFTSMESILDKSYDSVAQYELRDLFYTTNKYTNTEADIKGTKVSTDKILYHIIQDYYMRPYINSGDIIDYDFMEFESELEKDSDDNTLITTMDATKEDKLEI